MANALTALRLLLVPVCTWAFAKPGALAPALLTGLLVLAIVTDYFDGIVARATGTASAGGMLFDHSTDFLFVTSSLAGAAWAGLISPWLPPLIVVAFSQYVLDSYWLYRRKRLRMSAIGRWNGIFYFLPLLLMASAGLLGDSAETWLLSAAAWVAYLLIASTLISIVDRAIAPLHQHGGEPASEDQA